LGCGARIRWRDWVGVRYLLEEAEERRRDVAEVEEEAEQRHGRRCVPLRSAVEVERASGKPLVCFWFRNFELEWDYSIYTEYPYICSHSLI
jgi:hypothetical protein